MAEAEPGPSPGGRGGLPRAVGRLQGFADLLGGWALRWWLDLRVEGAEHVPARGAAIVAMNHESALDIPVAAVACPRRITFMAKRELFRGPFTSWALERLGGFRVERERYDLRAVRIALEVLRRGEVLGMYPEGTRAPGELLPFLPGSAWLALRTGAPLVPTAILGTERAADATRPRRVRVQVRFGEPIRVAPVREPGERRRRAEALTRELRARIEGLLARA
ncbi:MAG: 1-acyl-sn-glycerol-3-phosphate acyltransferase [Actinomycetota bacterium]|nr:MAG: 1-acyl-sn-glycerol-3-phosphate acyltransferase [Actinomycetota bacterium]